MNKLTIEQIELKAGGHRSPESGLCLLEAAAYLAGEKHSDHPDYTREHFEALRDRQPISRTDRQRDEWEQDQTTRPILEILNDVTGDSSEDNL